MRKEVGFTNTIKINNLKNYDKRVMTIITIPDNMY